MRGGWLVVGIWGFIRGYGDFLEEFLLVVFP